MPSVCEAGSAVTAEWTVSNDGDSGVTVSFSVATAPARLRALAALGFAATNARAYYGSASTFLDAGAKATIAASLEPAGEGAATVRAAFLAPGCDEVNVSLRYAVRATATEWARSVSR